MNTISAERFVTGYDRAQRVIARAGAYTLVLQRNLPKTATPQKTASGPWMPLPNQSAAEKALTLLLVLVAASAIAIGLATSLGLVENWQAFQSGIAGFLR